MFVDLSLIPASTIERVEVLADGASAIYGSDAVAGVVNVRLRNDYEGAETRARFGSAKGFDEWQFGQIAGAGWSGGHLTLGYEFYRRGNLAAADRAYVTEDLRAFGLIGLVAADVIRGRAPTRLRLGRNRQEQHTTHQSTYDGEPRRLPNASHALC